MKTNLAFVQQVEAAPVLSIVPDTFGVFSTLSEKGLSSLTSSGVESIVSTTALAAFF